eukprot:gnl/MRDRNA2_/MRDRNA2_86210_c1_seq21.p1 gnl/MRDRNA2_/MRDRNA2_86210_c1~~gnl/MRDRNA2_/MRDRNA2_86210_c1_seq21.p1  ORF type:complete len:267 (+),score=27.70 gnl/MRDRNA2_/MRDRNA2_86210_c1_seq21:93-893(+)
MVASLLCRDHLTRGKGAVPVFNKVFFALLEVVSCAFGHYILFLGGGPAFWGLLGVECRDTVDPVQAWAILAAYLCYVVKVVRWNCLVSHTDTVGPFSALFVFVYHLYAVGSVAACAFISPFETLPLAMLIAGLSLTVLSLVAEAVADEQLKNFKTAKYAAIEEGVPHKDGNVCKTGLWGLCRHPNYFFNCFPFTGCGLLSGCWWLALVWFGIQVFWAYTQSMVQHEAYCAEKYGEEWEAYCEVTPKLFPLPCLAGGGGDEPDEPEE